jgi:hypothetical protein
MAAFDWEARRRRQEREDDAKVAYFRERLRPVPGKALGEKAFRRLIDELGDDDFETRERAQETLKAVTGLRPRLEEVARSSPDLEVRTRLEVILREIDVHDAELPRALRVLKVVERIGSPAARRYLRELAGGNGDARLTMEAKAALRRLGYPP